MVPFKIAIARNGSLFLVHLVIAGTGSPSLSTIVILFMNFNDMCEVVGGEWGVCVLPRVKRSYERSLITS